MQKCNKQIIRICLVLLMFLLSIFVNNTSINNTFIESKNNSISKSFSSSSKYNQDVENNFDLWQNLYWHDNSVHAEITNFNAHKVNFDIKTKNIITTKTADEIDGNNFILNCKQTTDFDVCDNSGCYTYGNNDYECNKRIINWAPILTQYMKIKCFDEIKTWGQSSSSPFLDVKSIWKVGTEHKNLTAKAVFANGDNQQYVYNSGNDFNFVKGVNKEFWNTKYNIWSVPYTYVKEIQYIYVFYNFVSRFLFTLQNNEIADKKDFKLYGDNLINLSKKFLSYFNVSDLLTIKSVNYNHHSIILGLNEEFINLINQIHLFFCSKDILKNNNLPKEDIANGKINYGNIDQVLRCKNLNDYLSIINTNNNFHKLLDSYHITQDDEIYQIVEALKEILTINFNYSIWNPKLNEYESKTMLIDFKQLFNKDYEILINPDNNGKYTFKISNLEVNENKNNHIFLPYSKNDFDYSHITNNIEHTKNDYCIIMDQEINYVRFNTLDETFLNDYPTNISSNLLIDKAIKLFDNNNQQIDNAKFINSFKILPDDLNGSINIEIKAVNKTYAHKYTGLKKIESNKERKIDVTKYQYGMIGSKTTKEEIIKILLNNGFSQEFINNSYFKSIKVDDKKGSINFELINNRNNISKNIQLYNFDPYFIEQKNDDNILNSYKPANITLSMLKTYLINQSPRFKTEHQNDLKVYTKVNTYSNLLTANFKFDNKSVEFTYNFNNKNNENILNIVCYCSIFIGVIGLLLVLVTTIIHKKKSK
ncbi:MAG: hypothetical protein PUB26_03430 [Mycoplasmataceae bacterium]|nr:hypothetical protein [Mycoplasmataceae bacterium]